MEIKESEDTGIMADYQNSLTVSDIKPLEQRTSRGSLRLHDISEGA